MFDIRRAARQLEREAVGCENRAKSERAKIKACAERGDRPTALVYAANAGKSDEEALMMRRCASRMDSLSNSIQRAMVMDRLAGTMSQVVDGMDTILSTTMDPRELERVMEVCCRFAHH